MCVKVFFVFPDESKASIIKSLLNEYINLYPQILFSSSINVNRGICINRNVLLDKVFMLLHKCKTAPDYEYIDVCMETQHSLHQYMIRRLSAVTLFKA